MPKHWALAMLVGYAILILFLSLASIGGFQPIGTSFDDKINHFGAYFILTLLIFNFFSTLKFKHSLLLAWLIASSYGVLMEVFQKYLTSQRMFDVLDMLANSFGALIAVVFVVIYRKLKLK